MTPLRAVHKHFAHAYIIVFLALLRAGDRDLDGVGDDRLVEAYHKAVHRGKILRRKSFGAVAFKVVAFGSRAAEVNFHVRRHAVVFVLLVACRVADDHLDAVYGLRILKMQRYRLADARARCTFGPDSGRISVDEIAAGI